MSDYPNKQRSESDAELERKVLRERKLTFAEAIGERAGPGARRPIPRYAPAAGCGRVQEYPAFLSHFSV
jgi:hypothetical protein